MPVIYGDEFRFDEYMRTINSRLELALCWTVFAPLVRSLRQRRMARSASYVYDCQRIDVLLSSIIADHEDLLS